MSENHTEASAPEPETDGTVSAHWGVAVIPGENVSIHYTVTPVDTAPSGPSDFHGFDPVRPASRLFKICWNPSANIRYGIRPNMNRPKTT